MDLEITQWTYDERNRQVREDRHLWHYAGYTAGTTPDGGALGGSNDTVAKLTVFDRKGRVIAIIDADADVYETRWDGADRMLTTIDPMMNQVLNTYDHAGNLVLVTEIESADHTSLVDDDEDFTTEFDYDALSRQSMLIEPSGAETSYEYDSRDNLVRTLDALGNEVEMRHDRLDRLLDTRTYLGTNGVDGTSSTNIDVITIAQSWDALSRMQSRTDDSGNVTVYYYDALSRRIGKTYGDATTESWVYNCDDELDEFVNQIGYTWVYVRDKKGRPTVASVSDTASIPLGTAPNYLSHDSLA